MGRLGVEHRDLANSRFSHADIYVPAVGDVFDDLFAAEFNKQDVVFFILADIHDSLH